MNTKDWFVGRRGLAALLAAAWMCGGLLAGCTEPQPGWVVPEPMPRGPARPSASLGPRAPLTAGPPPAAPRLCERTVVLGKSVRGEELKMVVLGEGSAVTFILGGIHGDEPASAYVAEKFLDHLRAHPSLCQDRRVAILAKANPDGLAAGTRVNARGVDLNRNFPASNWNTKAAAARYNGGAAAGAEPETRAIMHAVETLQPARIISLHAISGGRQCNNWDGPAEDLARRMSARNGYPAKGSIGYPTPGSMGTWAGIDRRIPMITLELPDGQSGEDCWRTNQQALIEAIR